MTKVERDKIEQTATVSINSIIKVHSALGPGLLESAYQACLAHELSQRGHNVITEAILPIDYEGQSVDNGYRVDMIVNDHLLIENKSVSNLSDVHQAQVITYLKLSGIRLGLLVNWNVRLAKDGIRRVALHL